jgi:hypothetical protein
MKRIGDYGFIAEDHARTKCCVTPIATLPMRLPEMRASASIVFPDR